MELEPYVAAREQWPASGRCILAQYDVSSIVVYQAFRAEIADEAVKSDGSERAIAAVA